MGIYIFLPLKYFEFFQNFDVKNILLDFNFFMFFFNLFFLSL